MRVSVSAGQTVTVDDVSMVKNDLVLLSPADGATVNTTTPVLSWGAYPCASTYRVHVVDEATYKSVVSFEEVGSPEYTFNAPLGPGKYYWSVEARNASRTDIAENQGYFHFSVAP